MLRIVVFLHRPGITCTVEISGARAAVNQAEDADASTLVVASISRGHDIVQGLGWRR